MRGVKTFEKKKFPQRPSISLTKQLGVAVSAEKTLASCFYQLFERNLTHLGEKLSEIKKKLKKKLSK